MSDETPVAGPSSSSTENKAATEHPIPENQYYAVEFPGFVQDGSEKRAIEHLGGQGAIERVFKRNAPKSHSLLELSWRPENPFAHPIPGAIVHANNILLKVTKRKRKRRNGEELPAPEGEFIAEAVGVIPKTVRFRSMADFQYNPDPSDPVVQFRSAMDRMDVEYIRNYRIPPEKEDYELPTDEMEVDGSSHPGPSKSNLRLIPPPVFTRQTLPQIYNYKANPLSVVTSYIDSQTGEEKKRLINKSRWKGYGPATLSFSDKVVPSEPPEVIPKTVKDEEQRLVDILKQKFEERPCWTKVAILNQFDAKDAREITNSKYLLPMVSYVFADGPWRDIHLRFGYDPRVDPSARFYQRLYFRNINHPIVRPSVLIRRMDQRITERPGSMPPVSWTGAQSAPASSSEEPPSHIFDGRHITKETAAFQLCDITDPLLSELIEDEEGVRDECNERDGWYTTEAIERIKTVLRHKFFALLEGHIPSDEECRALLEPNQESRSQKKHVFQPRKHNMAKGAVPPEEAAAVRLRAKLNSATREKLSKG
ncbi:TFC1 [Sanghuangporus weigelae]